MLNTFFGKDKTFSQNRKCLTFWEYEYDNGNKLLNVTDDEAHPKGFDDVNKHMQTNQNDFEYDTYGNLIIDRNKGITNITYNHLHLPKTVFFGSENKIAYFYNANGVKVMKKVKIQDEVITRYLDGFQYSNSIIDFFPHAEGYVSNVKSSQLTDPYFHYVFNYTDHLGNIRLRFTNNPKTDEITILEEDHYYPFGLKHNGYNSRHDMLVEKDTGVELVAVNNFFPETYKYKFGGKELQSELGLGMYDFGARNYDPALGRWMNIDPLAEKMRRHSPYNFGFNNPLRFIDPDGMAPFDVVINGELAGKAVDQLNSSVEGQLKITRDEGSGQLSYERTGEGPLTKDAQQLASAIDDSSVIVNVDANSSNVSTVTGGSILGGEFQGSTTTTDPFIGSITETKQQINPNQAEIIDKVTGEPGKVTLHEIVESYLGGVEAQNRGLESVPAATAADAANPSSVYRTAHDNAPSPSFIPKAFTDMSRNQTYIKDKRGNKRYFPGQNDQ